ncbi:hypothetical protein H2O64_02670 [Kordia sp. YSTF-M3]|uniref:Six-cysteine peptide SCIFF n=1 Tax=Kordia aestuariivivens TaxID=2759037 RepID=A0ABR7Q4W9_9FLAO|nr:hypothetical protein [Kordia aestuariivivens]MBC8753558.1 hypothetical protein [Kordia aestuariivivens]
MKNKKRKLDLKIFKIAHLTSSSITGGEGRTKDENTCAETCKATCPPGCDIPDVGNGEKSRRDTNCPSRQGATC